MASYIARTRLPESDRRQVLFPSGNDYFFVFKGGTVGPVGMWESRSDFQGRWKEWKSWGWFSRLPARNCDALIIFASGSSPTPSDHWSRFGVVPLPGGFVSGLRRKS
jgi:hypothetical protein